MEEYNELERQWLHHKIISRRSVSYGGSIPNVLEGDQGVIIDYDKASGYPVVCWDYSHERTIISWQDILVTTKVENYTPPPKVR